MNFHMSWNKPNFNSLPNLVEIAGDKLQCFVDAAKKIDERAEYNSMGQRKPVPGIRFFSCEECGLNWSERTRDCKSPSNESCPDCNELNHPNDFEEHPEWPLDKSGNLL